MSHSKKVWICVTSVSKFEVYELNFSQKRVLRILLTIYCFMGGIHLMCKDFSVEIFETLSG